MQSPARGRSKHDNPRHSAGPAGLLLFRQSFLAMSDTEDAIDLVGDADLFDDTESIELLAKLSDNRSPRQRREDVAEAQEKRAQLLMRAGYTVRVGPTGSLTVFRGPDQ